MPTKSRSKPQRLMKKRRQRMLWRFIFLGLGLLFLIALPAILGRLSFWQIETISISGTRAVPDELVRDRSRSAISGSYLGIYPRGNILLFSKKRIVEAILAEFPRIQSVSVDIENFHSIAVSVVEREPEFLWCQNDEEACYFLDMEGNIFDHAPEFTGSVYVAFFGQLPEGTASPIGSRFLEFPEFEKISFLVSGLKVLALSPSEVRVIADKEYAITLSTGEIILLATLERTEETLANLQSVLSDPKLSLRSGTGLSVETLDMRYGNKVFYRKKR